MPKPDPELDADLETEGVEDEPAEVDFDDDRPEDWDDDGWGDDDE